MTLLACRKGLASQQFFTHPSARVTCVGAWFTPLLPGNQSTGPRPSLRLGRELSMLLLPLSLPLKRARDTVFLDFRWEGGKGGASAADKDPGDLKVWEVLVPKVPLTNRAAWPFHGTVKCHIRPRPWQLRERGQSLLLAWVLMVETLFFLHPLCKPAYKHHKHNETWILRIIQLLPMKDVPLMTARKHDKKRLFELGVLPNLPHRAASATVRESFVVVTLHSGIMATLNLNYGVTKGWWGLESRRIISYCHTFTCFLRLQVNSEM